MQRKSVSILRQRLLFLSLGLLTAVDDDDDACTATGQQKRRGEGGREGREETEAVAMALSAVLTVAVGVAHSLT